MTTWTAPEVPRTDPPYVASEREALDGWLDYHRATLLTKCQGLAGEQLARRAMPPSTLSLLGLVRHLADVERSWFRRRFAGETGLDYLYSSGEYPDGEFDLAAADGAEADFAAYARECGQARAAAAGRSLDETFVHERDGSTIDLRWVYVHMIEEYARHNGHADLLREQIDGVTGE
ncbi:MAG: DinB family protein [Streptosporangiaceae bacterium]